MGRYIQLLHETFDLLLDVHNRAVHSDVVVFYKLFKEELSETPDDRFKQKVHFYVTSSVFDPYQFCLMFLFIRVNLFQMHLSK